MASHTANYGIVEFSTGVNGPEICGNGITAATVHEVYCTGDGSVSITAFGGGSMTVALTAGESVKVLCSTVNVASGTFVGFRASNAGLNNRLLG